MGPADKNMVIAGKVDAVEHQPPHIDCQLSSQRTKGFRAECLTAEAQINIAARELLRTVI
ncbi:hypothetical protein D3C85_1621020 [compost metagenome]